MAKVKWRGGALLAPVPPVMVSCGDMERSNIITVAWTGILNTIPPKTYISVRPSRYSYELIKERGEFVINLSTAELIRTVDSCGASLGVGLLACRASDLRSEGKALDEAADTLEQEKLGLCEFFTVGSLEYLKRSGRVSAATAAIGSVLNIKPLLYGDYEGHIVSCAKPRGRKKAIAAILEKYQKLALHPENSRVFISHGDCPEEAQQLAEQVCAIAQPKELIICPHEPFTGCHVGPGMLALFFQGTARLDT